DKPTKQENVEDGSGPPSVIVRHFWCHGVGLLTCCSHSQCCALGSLARSLLALPAAQVGDEIVDLLRTELSHPIAATERGKHRGPTSPIGDRDPKEGIIRRRQQVRVGHCRSHPQIPAAFPAMASGAGRLIELLPPNWVASPSGRGREPGSLLLP